MNFILENDGINHINVYSKGKTELGKFLSNFTYCNLKTDDGDFKSVEGYWYWCLSDKSEKAEIFRTLYGYDAKKFGKLFLGKDWPKEDDFDFQRKICNAIQYKINNSNIKNDFFVSTLPFDHYYVYNDLIIRPMQGRWILDFLEKLRKNQLLDLSDSSQIEYMQKKIFQALQIPEEYLNKMSKG